MKWQHFSDEIERTIRITAALTGIAEFVFCTALTGGYTETIRLRKKILSVQDRQKKISRQKAS
jgi:hypothetical protein